MLLWASLVVLAVCAIAFGFWPLDAVMIEPLLLLFSAALFLFICAAEARH
jgi:hypothetical protein